MTVGELVGRLLWIDYRLPVVFRASPDAQTIAVEIAEVEHLAWLPPDAIVALGRAVVIVASVS